MALILWAAEHIIESIRRSLLMIATGFRWYPFQSCHSITGCFVGLSISARANHSTIVPHSYYSNKQPPSIALGIYITDFSFSHQIRANHLQAPIAGQDASEKMPSSKSVESGHTHLIPAGFLFPILARVSTTAARGRTQVANAARLDGRAVCASLVLAGRHSKSQPSRSENNAAERLMEGKTPFHCLIESGQRRSGGKRLI